MGKLRGLGAVRNVVFRDRNMRGKVERYWVNESEMMREIYEEREVVTALQDTLGQLDVARLGTEAEGYVQGVLGAVPIVPN